MLQKCAILASLFTCLLACTFRMQGQVSHGGHPFPFIVTRSVDPELFVEMPAFDMCEQLRIDSLNESGLRSGFHFAYKFMTDLTRDNAGITFTQADGTRVWRLGIRSAGAYSLNILFSEYELPEGARLFLYNPSQTHILGAFNHLNNSALGKLPVSPVRGDELIIEYQEPAHVPFHGRLRVGEVNHDYRDIRGYEPRENDPVYHGCMEPLACLQGVTDKYNDIGRSVVLIIVNGESACTGTLINNTLNDGKPYLLTASHCLNKQFEIKNPDYEQIAGNIVTFFNYESPRCNPVWKGTEEMSMASAYFRATNESTDMALLELTETPPAYYQPYYAGWNAKDHGVAPYVGIHHPGASVKRINRAEEVESTTFNYAGAEFIKDGHWIVKKWITGSTAGGSSGSPIFDDMNRVIGALSGGESSCPRPYNDLYFMLSRSWDLSPDKDKQLKIWLDPAGTNSERICNGLDPYGTTSCIRLSNVKESGKVHLIESTLLSSPKSGPAFGNNSLGMDEFAEAYTIAREADLYGIYIVNPPVSNKKEIKVEITVYSGSGKPEQRLYSESFSPSFVTIHASGGFVDSVKSLNRSQESFITFPEPIHVSGSFFVGYKILSSSNDVFFSAYNLPEGEADKNTAWFNWNGQWTEASAHPASPMNTSLFIDPVIRYTTASANTSVDNNPIRIFAETSPPTVHALLPATIPEARYSILSMAGKTLQSGVVYSGQNTIAITHATPGIYLVQITYDAGRFTQKILL